MKHLVIGLGEVGSAIQRILQCDGTDATRKRKPEGGPYDMLHICFPYSDSFVESVEKYVHEYVPKYVVVHSTVPVGTCDAHSWIHSPVRGVHPNLELGIRTFTKYFGGINADVAAGVFDHLDITTLTTTHAKDTEALKLWDTTQLGVMVILEKEIYAYCERHGLDFDMVYRHANKSYNEGYMKLGRPEVVRPYLAQHDGPIGGHCVIPNATIMRNQEAGHYMVMLEGLLGVNSLLEDAQDTAQGE
jgi:hypothetical protein